MENKDQENKAQENYFKKQLELLEDEKIALSNQLQVYTVFGELFKEKYKAIMKNYETKYKEHISAKKAGIELVGAGMSLTTRDAMKKDFELAKYFNECERGKVDIILSLEALEGQLEMLKQRIKQEETMKTEALIDVDQKIDLVVQQIKQDIKMGTYKHNDDIIQGLLKDYNKGFQSDNEKIQWLNLVDNFYLVHK